MNLQKLQADLRHFAAERDWQPFHTPKNLSTALMVDAAKLAGLFQWMSAEESQVAHEDAASKQRIGDEAASVLIHLLQVADSCQIDIASAVTDKLARSARKHPAQRTIVRMNPEHASVPGTHVLLDYENVQPTDEELQAMVPSASRVWVFHGPHQRQIEERFTSFASAVTAVPISKTGKNALDFHLSFYMGYIASRNPDATLVVVANDQGYAPMLEHAKAMGFGVRQLGHGTAKVMAKRARVAKRAAAKKTLAKKPAAKQAPAAKAPMRKTAAGPTATNKAPAKKAAPARKTVVGTPVPRSAGRQTGVAETLAKVVDTLRKMGDKRPVKPASLRRALKSLLGPESPDASVETALGNLIAAGVLGLGTNNEVPYPGFASLS